MIAGKRICLFAVVARNCALAPLPAIADDLLPLLLPYRDLAAVVAPAEPSPLPHTSDRLLRHEHFIETLMTQTPALPMRYGTVLDSVEIVLDQLATGYALLKSDLTRLAQCVEFQLRIQWDPRAILTKAGTAHSPNGTDPAPGDALRAQALALETWLRDNIGAVASDITTTLLATDVLPVRATVLVHRADLAALLKRVTYMQFERPDFEITFSGPWPPYDSVNYRFG